MNDKTKTHITMTPEEIQEHITNLEKIIYHLEDRIVDLQEGILEAADDLQDASILENAGIKLCDRDTTFDDLQIAKYRALGMGGKNE